MKIWTNRYTSDILADVSNKSLWKYWRREARKAVLLGFQCFILLPRATLTPQQSKRINEERASGEHDLCVLAVRPAYSGKGRQDYRMSARTSVELGVVRFADSLEVEI